MHGDWELVLQGPTPGGPMDSIQVECLFSENGMRPPRTAALLVVLAGQGAENPR